MKTDAFALRHIGPRETDHQHMLKTIGVESIEQLVYETLPDDIRLKAPLNLDPAMTEYEFSNHIHQLGNKNKVFKIFCPKKSPSLFGSGSVPKAGSSPP